MLRNIRSLLKNIGSLLKNIGSLLRNVESLLGTVESVEARSICGSRRLRLAVFATALLWRGSLVVLVNDMWLFFYPCN